MMANETIAFNITEQKTTEHHTAYKVLSVIMGKEITQYGKNTSNRN